MVQEGKRTHTIYYKEKMPVRGALDDYYNTYVHIDENRMDAARAVVERIKTSILAYLDRNCGQISVSDLWL